MGTLDFWKETIDEPVRKAHENVERWHTLWGPMFSGHVKVGSSEETAKTDIVGHLPELGSAYTHTRLPFGIEDASAMFVERDRFRALAAECGDIMPTPAEITARAVARTQEIVP